MGKETYHISYSPCYSEDIHTNYTDITLGYYSKESWPRDNLDWNYEYLKLTLGPNFSIQSRDRKTQTWANNDHPYKSGQDCVFITNQSKQTPDTNTRVKPRLRVYHTPWLATKDRYTYASLDWSSRSDREKYAYDRHWIPLLRIEPVIYSDLVGLNHLTVID